MNTTNKKKIGDSYEFTTEEERLLARVIEPHSGYSLKKGDLWILGPTPKIYYHPANVLAYDIQTKRLRGRYKLSWFEVIGVFETEKDLYQYLSTSLIEEDIKEDDEEKEEPVQLSIFDML